MATLLGYFKWKPSENDEQIIKEIEELSNSCECKMEMMIYEPSKYSSIIENYQIAVRFSGFSTYLFLDYYENKMKSFFFDCRQILDKYKIYNIEFKLLINSFNKNYFDKKTFGSMLESN